MKTLPLRQLVRDPKKVKELTEARLDLYLQRGSFRRRACRWEDALEEAELLSAQHTSRLGCRAYDILHVAFALQFESDLFITCDARQAKLARSAGLKVRMMGE